MSKTEIEKLGAAARVTHSILELLAKGVRPWARPWRDDPNASFSSLPLRANGEPYRGINVVALWSEAHRKGYASPYWFTYKQASAAGAKVRKGEHGSFVVFFKPRVVAADDPQREPLRVVLRGYVVFNRAQIEGLPDEEASTCTLPAPAPVDDALATRFARVPAKVEHGASHACYLPIHDVVRMPSRILFQDQTQYYATLAHELTHWTKHPSRLDRDFGQKRFADHGYALEELVAELGAAIIGAVVGLPCEHIEDHASYIATWMEVLRDQPSAFLTAAAKAQIAADYLLRLMGEAEASAPPDD